MSEKKIPMATFKYSDCLDFVETSNDGALCLVRYKSSDVLKSRTACYLMRSTSFLRFLNLGQSSQSVSSMFSHFVPQNATENDTSFFSPSFDGLYSVSALWSGQGICFVTRSTDIWSVWRVLLTDGEQKIESCSLCMTFPTVCNLFEACWIDGEGVHAVCTVEKSQLDSASRKVLLAFTNPTEAVMRYTTTSGWSEWISPTEAAGMRVSDIKLSAYTSTFVLQYQSESMDKSLIVLGSKKVVWEGKSVGRNSVRISDNGNVIIWRGVAQDVARIRTSHSRLYVYSVTEGNVRCISPSGNLIIFSGFFSRTDTTVWYTVQRGVSELKTYLYDVPSGETVLKEGPPITSPTATKICHKTESLDSYPTIVYKGGEIPLWTNLRTEALRASKWLCSRKPRLEGVMYSSSSIGTPSRPVVINLHGGPSMAISPFRRSLVESSDWFLPLVSEGGFDVLTIAYSGTLGFGDEYSQSSIGSQGIIDLSDVVHSLADLSDSGRIIGGIIGGSYGGFLALHTYCSSEMVPKVIALYPYISSRACAAETGDFGWETEYCGVEKDNIWPVPRQCIQPDIVPKLYSVENLKKPLLLMHGDSDNVCPVSQSRQTYNILRQRGAGENVQLVVYKGEGHGFRDGRVRRDCIERILKFLN